MSTNYSGLNAQEVVARVAKGEVNYTKKFTTRTIGGILASNILTLLNAVLLISVVALILIHAYVDAVFLAAVTFFNTVVGIIEEVRAKISLDRIALLHKRTCKVIRETVTIEIPISEVVLDDLVVVQPGDQIIADGVVINARNLTIDESLLTGEADAVSKPVAAQLLSGSFCVGGSGIYQVTGVGSNAKVNILTAQAKSYKITRTPLQKDINTIIEALTAILILFVILLLIAGFSKDLSLATNIMSIVTVIKAFVPQGLILFATLAFALGAIRVAQKQVLVQKLNAIEAMSNVTTLCLDKTGTLGTNKLIYRQLYVLGESRAAVEHQLQLFVGACSVHNSSMAAIAAVFAGIKSTRLDELPFTSAHKVSAVRVQEQNAIHSLWLGAPEVLAAGNLSDAEQALLQNLRNQGLRVLLFAQTDAELTHRTNLQHLAFIVLQDELRPNVSDAVKFFEARKIKLKILSGDHPETIAAIAKRIGMQIYGKLVNGRELTNLTPDEFKQTVNQAQFFGNLTPQDKQKIVQTLQAEGESVGMIGDGVNDVLALKYANIGVAMNSGAAAARDVADIILLQDKFTHLPELSYEGDRIIYNSKRIARLFVTKNIYCFFYILFIGFIGLNFPLTPRYITWIDFLTLGMPTMLLMLVAPTLNKQSTTTFVSDTLKFAGVAGLLTAFCALLVYVVAHFGLTADVLESQTASVGVIIFMELYLVYNVAAAERQADSKRILRWLLWGILVLAIGLNVLAINWSVTRTILGLGLLHLTTWMVTLLVAVGGVLLLHFGLRRIGVNSHAA